MLGGADRTYAYERLDSATGKGQARLIQCLDTGTLMAPLLRPTRCAHSASTYELALWAVARGSGRDTDRAVGWGSEQELAISAESTAALRTSGNGRWADQSLHMTANARREA